MSITKETVAHRAGSVHHIAICPRDLGASLRFYRDGLGLTVLSDNNFDGPWEEMFNISSGRLRSVFLGDPSRSESGLVELVDFDHQSPSSVADRNTTCGFLLHAFIVDVSATVERLRELGLDDGLRTRSTGLGHSMAVVRDPDGVLVELLGAAVPNDDECIRTNDIKP